MAYPTNYAEWVDFVRDFLDVDDFDNDRVSGFLSLAQTRLNRELNSQWMEKQSQLTIAAGVSVPIVPTIPDYNRVRLISPASGGLPLDTLAFNEYKTLLGTNSSGGQRPFSNYSIEGQSLYIYPIPTVGDVFDFYYYMMVPEISDSVASNVFTQYHPDILLVAACLAGSFFIVEDERIPTWERAYNGALDSINGVAKNAKMGSTPLKRNITLYRVK